MKRWRLTGKIMLYVVLSLVLIIQLYPYVWLILGSLKLEEEIYTRFLPSHITKLTLDYYRKVINLNPGPFEPHFLLALINSFFVAGIDTIAVILTSAITAYALTRLRFRGRVFLQNFIIFQWVFPRGGVMIIIPLFLLINALGLMKTYGGMILPFLTSAWGVFLYSQYFRGIPQEIVDAARADGASEARIVFSIMLPMAGSVTAIIALFNFLGRWNELLWDLLVIRDAYNKMTLNVLVATYFQGGMFTKEPGVELASAVLLTIPILLLFFAFRRYFVEGITMRGMKG